MQSPEYRQVVFRAAAVFGIAAGVPALIGYMGQPGPEHKPAAYTAPLPEVDCLDGGVNPSALSQEHIGLNQAVAGIESTSFFGDQFSNQNLYSYVSYGLDKIRGNTPIGEPYTKKQNEEVRQLYNFYDTYSENNAVAYLKRHGLAVSGNVKTRDYLTTLRGSSVELGAPGMGNYLVGLLADTPTDIVKASGLREVVFVHESTKQLDAQYETPKIEGATVELGDDFQLTYALAQLMINRCADRGVILSDLENLSAPSGGYGQTPPNKVNTFIKKYGKDYFDQASMTSPQTELLELMSNAISGWNWFDLGSKRTELDKKEELVQTIFNHFVRNGNLYEAYGDYQGYYGDPGDFGIKVDAKQILQLANLLNSASPEETKSIWSMWANGEGVSQIEQSLNDTAGSTTSGNPRLQVTG